jgi:hypothetical protein
MPMNSRELDLTDYQIRFNNNVGRLIVIIKYFVNE